jgi:putative transposase
MKQNYWQTFYENSVYHVYNRTNNKELLFIDRPDRQFFMRQWQTYLGDYLDTYAYCLMSNHFHFVVKIKTPNEGYWQSVKAEKTVASMQFLEGKIELNAFLEDQFKRFFTSYANTINKKYKRHGSLFQKRFKRVEQITLLNILTKICYTHHNPLHHNAASFYDGWEFSSYRAYLSDKPTKISRNDGLKMFDDNHNLDFFVAYHQSYHENWVQGKKWEDFEDKKDN